MEHWIDKIRPLNYEQGSRFGVLYRAFSLVNFTHIFRVTQMATRQSCDCHSANEETQNAMGKYTIWIS